MKICYFYINHYKSLSDVGFTVDCRYEFSYDKDKNELTVNDSRKLPDRFWDKEGIIYSISAIVGDNGTGKSTAICFLMESLAEGYQNSVVDGFVVWEQNGELFCNKEMNFSGNCPCCYERLWFQGSIFYYSGHFLPFVDIRDPRCFEVAGVYLATDSWMLVEDLQNYANADTHPLGYSFKDHFSTFISQNNHRICRMLSDGPLRKSLSSFAFPRFVLLEPNTSAIKAINLRPNEHTEITKLIQSFGSIKFRNVKDKFQATFLFNNLLSAAIEGSNIYFKSICSLAQAWIKAPYCSSSILQSFYTHANNAKLTEFEHSACSAIYESVSEIFDLAHFKINSVGHPILYIDVEEDSINLAILSSRLVESHFTIASRYFDFTYSHSLDDTTCILSSGEQKLLDLFSRIYDASIPFAANKRCPSVLLLDEAEIGFHPEWQRRFVSLLIDFIKSIPSSATRGIQILISTHSPVLLSDIPGCCVNYLKRSGQGKTINVDQREETFARNVFELYRDSFFMSNGLVGEFAQRKIKEIEAMIDGGNYEEKDIVNKIALIGDRRIQSYLLQKVADRGSKDDVIRFYEKQIENLRSTKTDGIN